MWIYMQYTPEPSPHSYEEIVFREVFQAQVQEHLTSGDYVIQRNNISEAAQTIFGGRVPYLESDNFVDVGVILFKEDNDEVAILSIGDTEYWVDSNGVECLDDPDLVLDNDDLYDLRFLISDTEWTPAQTRLVAENLAKQKGRLMISIAPGDMVPQSADWNPFVTLKPIDGLILAKARAAARARQAEQTRTKPVDQAARFGSFAIRGLREKPKFYWGIGYFMLRGMTPWRKK
jgi:hypothetical protein